MFSKSMNFVGSSKENCLRELSSAFNYFTGTLSEKFNTCASVDIIDIDKTWKCIPKANGDNIWLLLTIVTFNIENIVDIGYDYIDWFFDAHLKTTVTEKDILDKMYS